MLTLRKYANELVKRGQIIVILMTETWFSLLSDAIVPVLRWRGVVGNLLINLSRVARTCISNEGSLKPWDTTVNINDELRDLEKDKSDKSIKNDTINKIRLNNKNNQQNLRPKKAVS